MIYNVHCKTWILSLQGPEGLDIQGEWYKFRAAFLEAVGPVEESPEYYRRRDAMLDRWCDQWGQTPVHSEAILSLCYCFIQMLRTVYGCENMASTTLEILE